VLLAAVLAGATFIVCSSEDDALPGPRPPFVPPVVHFTEPAVTGNSFYVDPVNGSPQGDGSLADPWRTIEEVFDSGLVENNVVITDHWHGITFSGAYNCRIVNNTVVDPNPSDTSPGPCWIMIGDHKDGTPSQGCTVRNNIAATVSVEGGVVEDHNYLMTDPNLLFVDWAGRNLHLRSTAPVIDSGSADLAPAFDFDGAPRPSGSGYDVGAYEFQVP